MKIVNCTPHDIIVYSMENSIKASYPPSGIIARAKEIASGVGEILGTPLLRVGFGDVVDLPAQCPDTIYIVSGIVARACPERNDIVFPADLVRDEKGTIIGCRAFATAADDLN